MFNPLILLAIFFVAIMVGNSVIIPVLLAYELSLTLKGVAAEAQIVQRNLHWRGREISFRITYEFVEFATNKTFRSVAGVSFWQYRRLKVGDTVKIVVLPHKPDTSRLAENRFQGLALFGAWAITQIITVYFFGLGPIPIVCVVSIISGGVTYWLINRQAK